ncbi:transcriptional regulator, LacI family [Deinococcus reticulitermitis]|uniref:Transcriptional regulator, LacI family n=1 Tax=Deinococcus reticulitermitis TaxID=856736 RepID=A0A1H7C355_9DEIO|nr:LacI family DNA-binding transcriptional regulator [Deinococcus reticulitermitis]SEJ84239.1 transcriptional regulator, LacI family [Deinococcus reticulitermitis]
MKQASSKHRPTIEQIARAALVSTGTVSRVINGHTTVATATRVRVEEVMRELGYVPDPAAQHLSRRTGQTLGISFAPTDPVLHPYTVLFRRALEGRTGQLGLQLLELRSDLERLRALPSAVLLMHAVSGDPRLAYLQSRGVPTVLIGHHPGSFWVAPDDHTGGALAADHLCALGHRSLAFLGRGPSQVAQDREAGFVQAAQAAGASVQSIESDFRVLGGYRALRRAWAGGARFTGLFAQSDESAAGAVAALQDLGVEVPGQVSVVGFDGLPEVPTELRLTTVAQDIPRIAHTALDLITAAMSGAAPRGEIVPVHLLPGGSSAPYQGESL